MMRKDTKIAPLLTELAACLCVELAKSELPKPCFCGVVPGGVTPIDVGDCSSGEGCGQAWVKLVTGYPSTAFPEPDATATRCKTGMAWEVEVGVARCVTVFSEEGWGRGEAPTETEREKDFDLQMADMAAMKRAIVCCFGAAGHEVVLGAYTPLDGVGGVGGGTWSVVIRTT